MADITMCPGTGCERRESCYRFAATPSKYLQSRFMDAPQVDGECEYYLKNREAQ